MCFVAGCEIRRKTSSFQDPCFRRDLHLWAPRFCKSLHKFLKKAAQYKAAGPMTKALKELKLKSNLRPEGKYGKCNHGKSPHHGYFDDKVNVYCSRAANGNNKGERGHTRPVHW